MTYLRRNNPVTQRARSRKIIVVATVVVLFFVHIFFPHMYGSILMPVVGVFWKVGDFVGDTVSQYVELVRSKKSLIAENERLTSEARSFDASLLMLETLRRENETLRLLLGRKDALRMTVATVLSRPPFSPYDSLIVDAGKAHNISIGDRVYAPSGTAIGDISEVYGHTSKVVLFSSPGRILPIAIGEGAIQVEAEGRGGGNFKAVLPADIGIEPGDPVRLIESRANVLGVVEEINVDSTGSLQTILFKMPISLAELSYVEVASVSTSTAR